MGSVYRFRSRYVLVLSLSVLTLGSFAAQANPLTPDEHIQIVGGSEVSASDPVASSTVALTDGSALCTASLIDKDLAVTAAHCVAGSSQLALIFGLSIDDSQAQIRKVVGSTYPSEYQGEDATGKDQYDIALVRFEGGIPAGYAPAKLLPADSLANGETVTLAGYGITDASSQDGAGVLRKVDVTIKNAHYGNTEVILDQRDGHGACHGDSGGPAFVMQGGSYYLWGVTNRGYPDNAPDDCMHYSVYTKIQSHAAWISSATAQLRQGSSR